MKRKVKHLLSALLALCMAFGLYSLPVWAAEASPAETGTRDNPWDISAEAGADNVSAWYEGTAESGYTLIISGEGRMSATYRSMEPPWKSIKSDITAVEIREGVTNVGAYAFNFCRALKTVSLPESLTEIGSYAFHCTCVKRMTIPVNVQSIGRMIATPTTYYEILGSPENVNNHAFSTSLVSAPDKVAAEALNAKTNVSALIVLNGGTYGSTDEDLANLSYGLKAPVKAGSYFGGWYKDAEFSGRRLAADRNGRVTANINNIYYAKWSDTPEESPAPPTEEYKEVTAPEDAGSAADAITLPDGYTWQGSDSSVVLIPGGTVKATAVAEDGSTITYEISKNPELIREADDEYEDAPGRKPAKYYEIGQEGKIVIKSTGTLEKLREVRVDGQTVDSSHYALESGSTILTFTNAYLDTLSAGDHNVQLAYEFGNVEVLLKVADSAAPTDVPEGSPSPAPSGTPEESPSPAPSGTPEESPSPAPSGTPEGSPSPAPSDTPEGSHTPVPSEPDTATPSPAPSQTPSDDTGTTPRTMAAMQAEPDQT